ncbi:hypothetical protein [Polaromonas sp. YR568]|uniref:hypothetical protein n=1 Tax=Polaromonas sp. YR568 TaxID=1855301 RepID=UPI00398BDC24
MLTPMPSVTRNRLIGYWWAPVTLIALVLAVAAYLHPYQPLELSDLSPQVVASAAALDPSFGKPVARAFKYATRRSYSSPAGLTEVEIRVTLQPMGKGLVMRQDDWYDLGGHSVVYQERYVLFRNLFSVHTRSREVAPLVHDLMGRVGWYNDSVESLSGKPEGGAPDSAAWKLDLTMDRISDTDGKSLTLQTTRYQSRRHCERSGQVDGAAIGAGFTGSYAKVSCRSETTGQSAERRSEYVWLPEHGIFLSLGFQQAPEAPDKPDTALDVKGRYVSFEALP